MLANNLLTKHQVAAKKEYFRKRPKEDKKKVTTTDVRSDEVGAKGQC